MRKIENEPSSAGHASRSGSGCVSTEMLRRDLRPSLLRAGRKGWWVKATRGPAARMRVPVKILLCGGGLRQKDAKGAQAAVGGEGADEGGEEDRRTRVVRVKVRIRTKAVVTRHAIWTLECRRARLKQPRMLLVRKTWEPGLRKEKSANIAGIATVIGIVPAAGREWERQEKVLHGCRAGIWCSSAIARWKNRKRNAQARNKKIRNAVPRELRVAQARLAGKKKTPRAGFQQETVDRNG